ncbi:hypothetical protein Scep_001256 [Stephania cephalantha]|uniref:Hflx-type G domain-containing protein n=1 Tax=Stephania cephalantha TaxID=152367 RepID=A0AAP0LAD8_9MAGN
MEERKEGREREKERTRGERGSKREVEETPARRPAARGRTIGRGGSAMKRLASARSGASRRRTVAPTRWTGVAAREAAPAPAERGSADSGASRQQHGERRQQLADQRRHQRRRRKEKKRRKKRSAAALGGGRRARRAGGARQRYRRRSAAVPAALVATAAVSARRQRRVRDISERHLRSGPSRLLVVHRCDPRSFRFGKVSVACRRGNSRVRIRGRYMHINYVIAKKITNHLAEGVPLTSRNRRAYGYQGPRLIGFVRISVDTYFGTGTDVNVVFVNAILSGVQQRNLERAWGKPVLDRVGLIIEIFNAHAETKEAMLQSELAALMYKRTRLVRVRGPDGKLTFGVAGEAEVVSARGRGSGGRGFISGAGETELQLQRRRIQERRNHLLSQIEEVRRTRALQRASRKRRGGSHGQGLSTVAVVGYTNAGKSTLVSALSDSDLYSDDRLFATVDTRVRSVVLPSGRKVLLSDTVGFISDLPVQLVEAFHATLEEVVEADLLVHVLDSSAENLEEQRSSVLQVLQQIGVPEDKLQNMIEVWNKIDLRGEATGVDESLNEVADSDAGCFEEAEELEGDCDASFAEAADGDDVVSGSEGNDETMGDQQDDFVEEWSTTDFPQDGSSECWKTANDQVRKSLAYSEMIGGNPEFQPPDSQCVETSAIMGVGLQELLYLIDEKLNVQGDPKTKGFDGFNRKWRPPRPADVSAAAVE